MGAVGWGDLGAGEPSFEWLCFFDCGDEAVQRGMIAGC